MKYIPYVNIKMGTKSHMRYSTGNALPLVQLPFGMASFCLQTEVIKDREGWFFQPDIPSIEGIRLTHQPSPWIGDHGTFIFTPQIDKISDTASGAWSSYRIRESVFQPHYLKVKLLRSQCTVELTPTERGAKVRLSYESDMRPYLSFLPVGGNYTYKLNESKNMLLGTNDYCRQGDCADFMMHYVAKFEQGDIDFENSYHCEGGIHIALNKKQIEFEIAISYIGGKFTENNLTGKSFDLLKNEAEENWEEKLSRIEIEGSEEQMRTFYSCMYRAFLFPHKSYEINKDGQCVHYSPYYGDVHMGVRYTGTGFWDTVRTQFPLFSLIAKEEYASMLEGFVNDYLEGGYLPRWISLGETGCMPSTLIDGVIAEASVNDIISNEILEKALKGMLKHATTFSFESRYGRNGVEEYIKLGYVPTRYKESVNLTLDSAYGDFCIAQIAKKLGYDDIYNEYMERSKNYKNLFHKESGFMIGKDECGNFQSDFDKFNWGGYYTEGSAYQNSFFVPHDIEGLCDLYGGKTELIQKLDELFSTEPKFRVNTYGAEIHEMTEMAQADLYQFAISNQPSFHIPYIYGYLGETEKCRYWVGKARELFSYKTEIGFPGDEDNGSMASWYILSTIGKYKLCPGKNEYVEFQPFVKYNMKGE